LGPPLISNQCPCELDPKVRPSAFTIHGFKVKNVELEEIRDPYIPGSFIVPLIQRDCRLEKFLLLRAPASTEDFLEIVIFLSLLVWFMEGLFKVIDNFFYCG
jgi:hypothetical protein